MARQFYIKQAINELTKEGISEDKALQVVTSIYRFGISDTNRYFVEGRDENISIGTLKDILVKENITL